MYANWKKSLQYEPSYSFFAFSNNSAQVRNTRFFFVLKVFSQTQCINGIARQLRSSEVEFSPPFSTRQRNYKFKGPIISSLIRETGIRGRSWSMLQSKERYRLLQNPSLRKPVGTVVRHCRMAKSRIVKNYFQRLKRVTKGEAMRYSWVMSHVNLNQYYVFMIFCI